MGRGGEGPGEYSSPLAFGWKQDTLWVLDIDSYRISLFDPDARFLGDLRPEVDIGRIEQGSELSFPPRPRALLADGSI